MKFEDSSTGVIGSDFYHWTRGKVVVDYPTCKRHGLWLSVLQLAYPISIYGMIFAWLIHDSLWLFFSAVYTLNHFLKPVSIKGITKTFYTLKIRNEDYAREFALLNNFDSLEEGVEAD